MGLRKIWINFLELMAAQSNLYQFILPLFIFFREKNALNGKYKGFVRIGDIADAHKNLQMLRKMSTTQQNGETTINTSKQKI